MENIDISMLVYIYIIQLSNSILYFAVISSKHAINQYDPLEDVRIDILFHLVDSVHFCDP